MRMDVEAAHHAPSMEHAIVQIAVRAVIVLLVAEIARDHVTAGEIPEALVGEIAAAVVAVSAHVGLLVTP
jgi:hypothetical protein